LFQSSLKNTSVAAGKTAQAATNVLTSEQVFHYGLPVGAVLVADAVNKTLKKPNEVNSYPIKLDLQQNQPTVFTTPVEPQQPTHTGADSSSSVSLPISLPGRPLAEVQRPTILAIPHPEMPTFNPSYPVAGELPKLEGFPVESGVAPLTLLFNEVKEQQVNARVDRGAPYHEPKNPQRQYIGKNGTLPGFPDSSYFGRKDNRHRWKLSSGKFLEWDSLHGEVEMYSKNGKHLGAFDPETGSQLKDAKPGRRVEK
jgi:hypothetical protein